MNIVEEFIEWVENREIVHCKILNNAVVLAELNGKLFVGKELNNSGYPIRLVLCAENDTCSADIGYHYINKIIKNDTNHWYVLTDSYQHYAIS